MLPVTKKNILFKFATGQDEKERAETNEKMKKYFESDITNTVTYSLEQSIVAIDGITDKNKIRHFVQYMPAFDSKSLRKYITENQPGIDMTHDMRCDSCNELSNVAIPVTTEFFWPST
tara:strand:- start:592 stop:945 length:354 start_codon:yes stop_codon:yes gene_type:complete